MRAVFPSGVAMVLGATAASATESSLRGSASQAIPEAEEGKILDAITDVFFSVAEGSENEKGESVENSTESWDLSASAEVIRKCSQGWSGAVEAIAPGCLGQCARYGICASVGQVIGVWGRTHSREKAKRKACETKNAFACLLWGSHRKLCQPLINRAPQIGLPRNVNQACPRRLEETPAQGAQDAQDVVAPEAPVAHASEDNLGLHENVTLDAMVTAALSSSAGGCHCSGGELRQCGLRCFSKRGSVRVACITDCLDARHPHWCSSCYARRSDCALNKCFNKCSAAPGAQRCLDCVHGKCGGECR